MGLATHIMLKFSDQLYECATDLICLTERSETLS